MKERWVNPCKPGGDFIAKDHLGGTSTHGDPDSWFPELWDWLIAKFDIMDVLDVGCGVGFTQKYFDDVGLLTWGIDCELMKEHHLLLKEDICALHVHDFTKGPTLSLNRFDLVWCCEVAEHIEEHYQQNLVDTIVKNCCKVVAFCAAPPKAGGHHHVNCKHWSEWVKVFEENGLTYQPKLTQHAIGLCTESNRRSANNYFRRSGLVFTVGKEILEP